MVKRANVLRRVGYANEATKNIFNMSNLFSVSRLVHTLFFTKNKIFKCEQ